MKQRIRQLIKQCGKAVAHRAPRLAASRWGRALKAAGREIMPPPPPPPTKPKPKPTLAPAPTSAPTAPVPPVNAVPSAEEASPPPPVPVAAKVEPAPPKPPPPVGRDDLAPRIERLVGAEPGTSADLVLCCAFTGRHHIVRQIVSEAVLNRERNVHWMLTGSTDEDAAFIETLAATTGRVTGFVCENRPLGRKWQTCMHTAFSHFRSPLYGIVGSDDIVSHTLIAYIIDTHRAAVSVPSSAAFVPSLYCSLEWLVAHIDARSDLALGIVRCNYEYSSTFQPLGAGRFYTRAFIEECNGIIFESDKERQLDDRGFFEIRDRRKHIEYYTMEDGPLISVKGDWAQLNSFDALLDAPTVDVREFTFEGYRLLERTVGDSTRRFLFKPPKSEAQIVPFTVDDAFFVTPT